MVKCIGRDFTIRAKKVKCRTERGGNLEQRVSGFQEPLDSVFVAIGRRFGWQRPYRHFGPNLACVGYHR